MYLTKWNNNNGEKNKTNELFKYSKKRKIKTKTFNLFHHVFFAKQLNPHKRDVRGDPTKNAISATNLDIQRKYASIIINNNKKIDVNIVNNHHEEEIEQPLEMSCFTTKRSLRA